MAYEAYGQINGVIREIQRGESCCSQLIRLDTENGEVQFSVSADTMVIDSVRLRKGMRIAAFYDTSLPVPAIYPPQYRAEIVTAIRREQNVMLNFFDEESDGRRKCTSAEYRTDDEYCDTERTAVYMQTRKYGIACLLHDNHLQYSADDDPTENHRDV